MKDYFTPASKFILFSFFAFAIVLPQQLYAIGISPSAMTINNLANGLSVRRPFTVSRKDTSKTEQYTAFLQGDAAKYLKLETETFSIAAGEHSKQVYVEITPIGAPNGLHSVEIVFRNESTTGGSSEGAGNVLIRTGVVATLNFEIVDREVRSLFVADVKTPDTEVGLYPPLSYFVRNDGNVFAGVEKIHIQYVDITDEENVFNVDVVGNSLEQVDPLKEKILNLEVPINLPLGEYLVRYQFFFGEQVVFEGKDEHLKVWPQGTLAQSAELFSFEVTNGDVQVSDLIKIEGVIKNTGQTAIKSKLFLDIERDGKPIDFIKSDEKLVFPHSEAEYMLTFRPDSPGNYAFKGFFEYGPRSTNSQTRNVIVKSSPLWYIFAIPAVIIIILAAIIIRKRHKKIDSH